MSIPAISANNSTIDFLKQKVNKLIPLFPNNTKEEIEQFCKDLGKTLLLPQSPKRELTPSPIENEPFSPSEKAVIGFAATAVAISSFLLSRKMLSS